jgi:alcohol dehydrogenase (cytochrome c)
MIASRLALAALLTGMSGMAFAQASAPAPKTAGIAPPIQPDKRTGEIIAARKAVLDKITPVTDAMLKNPPPGEWLQWRRTYDAQGFSPLEQINKANVATLRPAWTWSLPAGTTENTPLVHDGVIFVFGTGDRLQALDATNGDLLWEYQRALPTGTGVNGQNGIKRNFAIYGDRLYLSTTDSHLVTIDVKTGKEVWDHVFPDSKDFRITSGPLIVNGKVIQGVASCPAGGCYIIGLDAADGKEVWRFKTVAQPGAPGDNTWNGLPLDQRFGGSVWTTGSYDPDLNLIYYGTGNTYAWQQLTTGGPNKLKGNNHDGLYIDSTVALNPDTGALKWHYQHLPEDYWDLDFAFEQQILTLPVNGKDRRVVSTTGKMVLTDVVDAATGKWVFTHDAGIQNIVKSIDPKTGRKTYDPATVPDLTLQRRNLQCSAGYGAKNWPANSYDARSGLMYVTIAEVCGESLPKAWKPGDPYSGGGMETRIARYQPGSDGNIGRVDAIDMRTQKTVWSKRQRAPVTSAALATAGGVLFAGDSDRYFKAYDSATGDTLWQMRLNDAVNSYPISYSVNGKQYVAVVAGYGGPRIGNLHQLTTEIQTPRGNSAALWVFEVPQGAK